MTDRYTHHTATTHTLHAWGAQGALEVTAPLAGVLRVRSAPHARHTSLAYPHLPEKRSFAVTHTEPQPISVQHEHGAIRVSAAGLTLHVDPRAGTWSAHDTQGRTLARARDTRGDPDSQLHRTTLTLDAPQGAAYLGFGEKTGPLDKRGLRFTFWNTDHFPYHTDSDPLYASITTCTVVHEGVATGLFLDESWRTEVDVAHHDPDALTWVSAGPELDLYVIAGPTPVDVLRRYTTLTGRHHLPPLWALGAAQSRWGYENEDDIRAVIHGYRSRDLPLDAVYVDIDYMDAYKVFTWDPQRFPNPKVLTDEALRQGVRLVPIIDPGVKLEPGYRVYEEAREGDHLVRSSRGEVLVGEVWPNPAVFPDFTREEVQAWWATHFQGLVDAGIHGVWNDMNEPACFTVRDTQSTLGEIERTRGNLEGKTLPYDARHGKKRHLEVHNVYALGMNAAARHGFERAAPDRRPFLVSRAGSPGLQRYAALWTGDNTSAWSHLALSVPMLCGLGLSGIAFCGADVGGFLGNATGELLSRWTQLGAFYPMMRNHAAAGTRDQEPWRFGDDTLSAVRDALRMRYRLLPLLYTLMWEAHETGLPPMRALAVHHADDTHAVREDSAFLFGPDVLVAPITRAGAEKRVTYLPEGQWLEFFNLHAPGRVLAGRQDVIARIDARTVPAYLRAGGAVPLTQAAPHTTTATWNTLTWHVHVAASVRGTLYEDAGDGHGEHRVTTLTGTLNDGTLRLERATSGALSVNRDAETLVLYGLGRVEHASGATDWTQNDAAVRVTVPGDWTAVTLTTRNH